MSAEPALKAALSLLAIPTQIKTARLADLPDGIDVLLTIVSGDDVVCRQWAVALERSERDIKNAAEFYIEQIMLFSGSNSYRVLGTTPKASSGELRANMALLMRWLHPDVRPSDKRAALANRVLAAWENLKAPEKRRAYDAALHARPVAPSVQRRLHVPFHEPRKQSLLMRVVSAYFKHRV